MLARYVILFIYSLILDLTTLRPADTGCTIPTLHSLVPCLARVLLFYDKIYVADSSFQAEKG